MPDTLTITREFMGLLNGIAEEAERWRVLSALFSYAADKTEPDGLSPIGECVFMKIRKTVKERGRKARYIAERRAKPSTVDAPTVDEKTVYSRRSDDLFTDTSNQHMNTDITPHSIFKNIQDSPHGENSTARRVFKVPTLDEVRDYISGKGYSVDPEEFYSFYESQGWHVGKNKMRDWHRAVSYWQCRINNRNKTRAQLRDYSGI